MVKFTVNSWILEKSERGRGGRGGVFFGPPSTVCTTTPRNYHYFLTDLSLLSPRLFFLPGSSWSVFLVFCLLLLSHVSEECPNTCHCKWKSGKESVSCFRASLTKIPTGLDPGTQVLNMSGNTMKSLPSHVFLSLNLLNLQRIFLSECELVSLERHVFSKLTNLVELDLSENRLEVIPSHTFPEIPELRELKMNSNPVTRISNDAFAPLRRLVRLELTSCQLSTIETWAFRELPALEWLRLDNNRLLTVQAESFFPLQSLHGLKMNGNPWNCSCALKPLRDWMLRNNVPFEGIPPICQEPLRLQGKPWDRLQLQDFACLPKLESLTQDERIRRVIEGHNTTFVCRLQATADTHVSWLMGSKGVSVTNGTGGWSGGGGMVLSETFAWKSDEMEVWGGEELMGGGGSFDRSLGLKISVLTVIRTTPRDAGVYTCKGESRAGSVAANFSLIVLQNKSENLPGRLLFTGTIVAAILTLIVCFLLSCVCLVGRHRRTTTAAATTANANYSSQHHHNQQENHDLDKIELNHIGVSQNGGASVPILKNHSQYNHTHTNPTSNNISPPNNSTTNSLLNRRPDYKALPTNDPDENFNDDPDNKPLSGPPNSNSYSKEKSSRNPFHEISDDEDSERRLTSTSKSHRAPQRSSSLDDHEGTRELSSQRLLSPTKSSPTKNQTTAGATTTTTTTGGGGGKSYKYNSPMPMPNQGTSSHSLSQSSTRDEQQSESQSGRDKFPDLIHEKMSMSFTTADFVSLPRPNRNHDTRPSYFHRRMNSESQSPLLSSSSAHHSYSNSVETHSLTSSESLAYSTSLLMSEQQQHGHRLHHQPHHHSHHSHHSQQQQQQHHRLSMPTSPLHESHSATYDYHAAQLAAFLEEYRLLQLELMRMSASLNHTQSQQQQQQQTPSAQVMETNVNDLSLASPLGGPAQTNNPITSPSSSSISMSANQQQQQQHQQQQSTSPPYQSHLHSSMQQNDLSHTHHHHQQLKSILKNPSHNNNYMA